MYHAARHEPEIRAVAPDRLIESPRLLPFTPRAVLTDADRWRQLQQHDPHAASLLRAAFLRLYELRVPEAIRAASR